MGYLSQKKRQERRTAVLNVAILLILLFTIIVIFAPQNVFFSHFIKWQFQYYIITLIIFVYSMCIKYFIHSGIILFFIIINSVILSSSSNIFFNTSGQGTEEISIVYQNKVSQIKPLIVQADKKQADIIAVNPIKNLNNVVDDNYRLFHDDADLGKSFILSGIPAIRSGTIHFSSTLSASYIVIQKAEREIMIINIDFSKMQEEEQKSVFKNLSEFVLEQNIPIIMVGDFGISSWQSNFNKFLEETGMKVKNRFILSDGKYKFNPLAHPTYNVLGYKALGLKKVEFLTRKEKNSNYPLLFQIIL